MHLIISWETNCEKITKIEIYHNEFTSLINVFSKLKEYYASIFQIAILFLNGNLTMDS